MITTKNSKKVFVKLSLSILISVGFIYVFNNYIGVERLIDLLTNLTAEQLIIGFFLYFVSYIVRTLRWRLTLDLKDFKKLFKVTVFNTFFNIVLPFRIGEISFFYMLKKEGVSLPQTTLSFVVTRIFDGLSLVGVFGLFYFLYVGSPIAGVLTLILSAFLFIPISFLIKKIKHQEVLNYHSKLQLLNLMKVYALSVLTLMFKFSAFYFVLPTSLSIPLSLSFLAFTTADLTTVLPIHGIAGIGTYEPGFASVLILLGFDREVSFLSATIVHIFIILSSLVIAAITSLLFVKRI